MKYIFIIVDACTAQTRNKPPDGDVTVKNYGAYTAQFFVSYTLDGYEQMYDSETLTANQKNVASIPGDAGNVVLNINCLIFIGIWKNIYSRQISSTDHTCIKLTGTVINPKASDC